MHFNVIFNVFFKLIKVQLLVSELCIYQNVRCNNKKIKNKTSPPIYHETRNTHVRGQIAALYSELSQLNYKKAIEIKC